MTGTVAEDVERSDAELEDSNVQLGGFLAWYMAVWRLDWRPENAGSPG